MAVSKSKKVEILAELEKELKLASSVAFTSNTKLTVLDITNIRRELIKVDAKLMLAKKTLVKIAFKNVYNVELNDEVLPWQVAVLISKWDKIAWISIVNKYANEFRKEEKIKFVWAYFDGQVLDAAATGKIANLPSREVLLAKLLGSMMSPLSALARFFDWAKNELEAKNVAKVWDLVSFVEKKEETKTEEAPVETKEEAKEEVVEAKEEIKTEEVPATEETTETPAE
ncbi:MAG: Ribosomal protein L10 [uncultured bacterium (gcode 4)]|uniref:Large ribosomal subunit protein uL10 n=1 Tax=uncultured bacterium (gcode 4) TaxID=1234023 RepID=K2FWK7_9BACT|nr:MAG: Ribosomal protein L10 [uncultured bacterium (gcode 4)]